MFFDVGFSELFLLAVLGLLILGPERLPAVARTLGGWVRRGRKLASEFQRELEREVDLKDIKQLRDDVKELGPPLREAAQTLDEGNSILDKTLREADQQTDHAGSDNPVSDHPDASEPHEPVPSTESSDFPDTLESHEPMPSTESSDQPDTDDSPPVSSYAALKKAGE